MKKKLIYVIIIILIFLICLTIYKYKVYETKNFFIYTEPKKIENNLDYSQEKDKDTYKDLIITEDLLEVEYSFIDKEKSILGKVYIDKNKDLYITDEVNKKVAKPYDYKFKTLYKRENDYNKVCVYLISEDNKLYLLTLNSSDIKKTRVEQVFMSKKVYNFVDILYKTDIYKNGKSLFVLLEDGNIYDAQTKIRYNSDIISMYDKFYVLKDKTMIDEDGNTYIDNNKEPYKIKYVFSANKNKIIDKETIMIITEDNKLLYIIYGDNKVYEFNKKVKDIQFSENKIAKKGELTITFKDNYKIKLDAACNKYFCINKLEE